MSSKADCSKVFFVPRDIFEDKFFPEEQFSEREAYMYLLCSMSMQDSTVSIMGQDVEVKFGDISESKNKLAATFGWSRPKLDRFLSDMQKNGMIYVEKSNKPCKENKCVTKPFSISYPINGSVKNAKNDASTRNCSFLSYIKKLTKKVSEEEEFVNNSESKIDYKGIVDFYNATVSNCKVSTCTKITDKRKRLINARLKQFSLDEVKQAIKKAAASDFCNGANDRNWCADFDFVFSQEKMTLLLEGKYDNRQPKQTVEAKQEQSEDKEYTNFLTFCKKFCPNIYESIKALGNHALYEFKRISGGDGRKTSQVLISMDADNFQGDLFEEFDKRIRNGQA